MTVRIDSRANREFAGAVRHYHRSGGERLAVRFVAAFDAAVARIGADPSSLPVAFESASRGPVRRCPLGRTWPYDLLFTVGTEDVAVISVWHRHRDPADRPG